jgi:anti-sigma B factor antagonist
VTSSDDADTTRPATPRFAIQTSERGRTYVIRALGELDYEHTEEFERAIETAEASDAEKVLVDLDGLWFIDSTGLRAMVTVARRDADGQRRLRFTRGTGDVAAMFRLTALDQTLPFE